MNNMRKLMEAAEWWQDEDEGPLYGADEEEVDSFDLEDDEGEEEPVIKQAKKAVNQMTPEQIEAFNSWLMYKVSDEDDIDDEEDEIDAEDDQF